MNRKPRKPQRGKSNSPRSTQQGQRTKSKSTDNKSKAPVEEMEDFSRYTQSAPRVYKVLFFDTFAAAKSENDSIKKACEGCDQLNVVIAAEGNMDDVDILSIDQKVKIFAGEAWTLIHQRRVEENWYAEPK
jgi:hypothetical protein